MITPDMLFERWYIFPLQMLRSIPNGDGGFIALATALFLYERYATAVLDRSGKSANDTEISGQFARDFNVDENAAKFFWKVMRNGILHQGMPIQKERDSKFSEEIPRWIFQYNVLQPVELCEIGGKRLLKVHPWLVVDKIVTLWQNNLDLIDNNESFPWANILPMESERGLGIVADEKDYFHPPTGSPSGLGMLTDSK